MYRPQQNEVQNGTEQIKIEVNLLRDKLSNPKKRQSLLQNGLKQKAKVQKQSRDELEEIAERRRTENYAKCQRKGQQQLF